MKVFIDDVYVDGEFKGKIFIESDAMQYMVNIYNGKVTDKGAEIYTTKGFFRTLEQAVKFVVRMKVNDSTATTLSELITDMRRIGEYIESKLSA